MLSNGLLWNNDFLGLRAKKEKLALQRSSGVLDLKLKLAIPPSKKLGGYPSQLVLNWYWLKTSAHGKVRGPSAYNEDSQYAQWNITKDFFGMLMYAFAKWKVHYKTLDLQLGRKFCIRESFSLKPLAG